ncbi:MAG: PTS system nitrogen regulatory IIA component [Polaribacter sp.]|jgi:PTS system nitrogen regulatory IIA component
MNICQLLSPTSTQCCDKTTSKKKVLEKISEMMAESTDCKEKLIYESLLSREKLGTTALGEGIAIPHARIKTCQCATAVFLLLDKPIDYDAPDGKPVDIIFSILVPENAGNAHLQHLAKIAKLLSDHQTISQIRHAHSDEALYEILEKAADKLAD